MKHTTYLSRMAALLAVVGLCFPQIALADALPSVPSPTITDVSLNPAGILIGQVVTPENAADAGRDVWIGTDSQRLAHTETDRQGYFAFKVLKGGVYHLGTATGLTTVRVWPSDAAPPSAGKGVLIVHGNPTLRGQHTLYRGSKLRMLLSNPWIIGGIVAAAVAIPVAIYNSKSPASP